MKILNLQINATHFAPLKKQWLSILCMCFVLTYSSCKKFVSIAPPDNQLAQENVYENDKTAGAVLSGLYRNLGTNYPVIPDGIKGLSVLAGVSADELTVSTAAGTLTGIFAYYTNSLVMPVTGFGTQVGGDAWVANYNRLFTCNAAIEGLTESTGLTPAVKQQLLGEAKFMRCFFYFYLVNLYGDVPLIVSIDPQKNRLLSRTAKSDVYKFIIKELTEAKELLSTDFLTAGLLPYSTSTAIERVRPTRWAAIALLARTYLYAGENAKAEEEATLLINNPTFSLASLNNVFLKNSSETIWQLQPVISGCNTEDGKLFNLSIAPMGVSSSKPYYASNFLLNAFEPGDSRKGSWLASYTDGSGTYYYPYKYKKGADATITSVTQYTEYLMVFRLAEQYLIRAEARANLNNISASVSDLNVLRTRARATPTTGVPNPLPALQSNLSQQQLLAAILHERQVEMFTEWGHRWLDIKRSGDINTIMTPVTQAKGGTWASYQQLYPIPYNDMLYNPNLMGYQNPGY